MSQENVEVVRRIQDAFLRGEYEAMFELVADDVEWTDARFIAREAVAREAGFRSRWRLLRCGPCETEWQSR
ncbi:MAG: hypothetical protein AABM42_02155 [Actinomycetota bacterium]